MQSNSPQSDPTTENDLLAYEDVNFLRRPELRGARLVVGIHQGRSRHEGPWHPVYRRCIWQRPLKEDHPFYKQAQELGRIVSERGGALNPSNGTHRNVICTGGGPGIMEAANRGAHDAGAKNIGLNIVLPHEQHINPYVTPGLSFQFQYFALRKMHFAMRANALVAFPGGFGTLDELFDILTLKQTGKASGMPIILYGRSFWKISSISTF